MQPSTMLFSINCFSKSHSFVLEGDFAMAKNKLFITLHNYPLDEASSTNIFYLDITDGGSAGDTG